jgi:biotin carboxylase
VLHHKRSFFPLELKEQVGDAAELLWLVSGTDPDSVTERQLLRRLGTVLDLAGMGIDEAAAALGALRPDGIVSFVDEHIETAAQLAGRLGLRYHSPEVARAVVDKRVQRDRLAGAGVAGPRYVSITTGASVAYVGHAVGDLDFPVVLKPAEGSASRGIRLVESLAELVALPEVASGRFAGVLEEYMPDDPGRDPRFASYLSVESVVSHGAVSHVAITGRFPLASSFRETGNFIPACVDPSETAAITDLAEQAVKALGIVDSVVHTEIKVTPEGPKIIEVNGRLGGRPPFVLLEVSDVNLFAMACAVAVGTPVRVDDLVDCDGVGFLLLVQPPATARSVASIDGLDALGAVPGVRRVNVMRSPGTSIDASAGTGAKVLTVQGRVADHDALAETVKGIERGLTIRYS